ncbi:Fe2+-dependent dioxygenase [Skermanella pratensis]|uniref:Fe2+-dependent dioxygenase n=1 Tax=Skermanella pratensis TaxID=2233999 RepID=UPI0013013E14|nr:Fe2+-dependent dioxygenase [Skermanella pratensis]
MQIHISDVLTADQVAHCRAVLESAAWVDGRVTAGHQSARTKKNLQVPESAPELPGLRDMILRALDANPVFMSATLPERVFPPLFNRYDAGMTFGAHVDNAIRPLPGGGGRIRTDISATLFLSGPDEYDGGELMIEDTYGAHSVKLPAGHMVVYPASSLHRVTPITRGSRWASFFWIQSIIRDDAARTTLFDLDMAINGVAADMPDHPSVVSLTNCYHNLIRRWAEV